MTQHQVNTTAYDRLIGALRAQGKTVNANGQTAQAQCPAHDDRNPSLALTDAPGKVLAYCHGGCDIRDILAALNLAETDLFNTPGGIDYKYSGGRIVNRTPGKQFRQRGNTKDTSLFQVEGIGDSQTVYVTEGEQDAANLAVLCNVPAVSPPQGAKTRADRWDWAPLTGRHVIIIADKDDLGRKHAEDVAARLLPLAASVTIMEAAVTSSSRVFPAAMWSEISLPNAELVEQRWCLGQCRCPGGSAGASRCQRQQTENSQVSIRVPTSNRQALGCGTGRKKRHQPGQPMPLKCPDQGMFLVGYQTSIYSVLSDYGAQNYAAEPD